MHSSLCELGHYPIPEQITLRLLMTGPRRAARGGIRFVVEQWYEHLDALGVAWRYVGTYGHVPLWKQLLGFGPAYLAVLAYLLFWRPHFIHLHISRGGSFVRGLLLSWLARTFRVQVIWHWHGSHFGESFDRLPTWFARWLQREAQRSTLHIAVSGALRADVEARLKIECVRIIENTAPLPPFSTTPSANIRIVSLVGDAPRKGLPDLMAAIPHVRAVHPQAQFFVAGCREFTENHILGLTTIPFLERDAKSEFLRNTTIYVHPSYDEGQSIALLEAMGHGLPIVATAVGGTPERIEHEHNGLLVPAREVNPLAAAIIRLLNDEQLRQELAVQARHTATKFTPELTRRQIKQFLALNGQQLRVTDRLPDEDG